MSSDWIFLHDWKADVLRQVMQVGVAQRLKYPMLHLKTWDQQESLAISGRWQVRGKTQSLDSDRKMGLMARSYFGDHDKSDCIYAVMRHFYPDGNGLFWEG